LGNHSDRGCTVRHHRISRSPVDAATRAVVSALSPEERDYEQCRAEIANRRRRLTELQTELSALKASLDRFSALCQSRLGDLMGELRRVSRAIADYERRLERLSAEPAAEPAEPEAEEPADFAWLGDEPPGAGNEAEQPAPNRPRRRRWLGDEAAEAKRLYLDLAKRCHPDLATTGEERQEREALMQRINEAFRDRDLAALRALRRESEVTDPAFGLRPARERLAWARAELDRLGEDVAELRSQITLLRASEAYTLWRRLQGGESIFETLEDDLEARVVAERRRLDGLIAAHRQLLDERRQSPVAMGRAG
jgi:hypothetical protein